LKGNSFNEGSVKNFLFKKGNSFEKSIKEEIDKKRGMEKIEFRKRNEN
jgi:hypothetical protein